MTAKEREQRYKELGYNISSMGMDFIISGYKSIYSSISTIAPGTEENQSLEVILKELYGLSTYENGADAKKTIECGLKFLSRIISAMEIAQELEQQAAEEAGQEERVSELKKALHKMLEAGDELPKCLKGSEESIQNWLN